MKLEISLFKLFVNLGSFSWIILFYLLNNKVYIFDMDYTLTFFDKIFILKNCKIAFNVMIYLFFNILFTWLSVLWINRINNQALEITLGKKKINPIYREYLPVFLSIIVVAFALKDPNSYDYTIYIIFTILFIIVSMSKIGLLNPIFYLLNYYVYKVQTDETEYILFSNESDYKSLPEVEKMKKVDEEILVYIKETNV